jgi:predicted DCC family thiol-disulfide oxidoreductase YuxK
MVKNKHLLFYDGSCGLCHRAVQFVLKVDKRKQFLFAPLQGETAAQLLKGQYRDDSLILLEDYQGKHRRKWVLGKGALRLCWLLGGMWKIPGILSFLPGFLYNWVYRLIARFRYQLFPRQICLIPDTQDISRFLP